MYAHPTHVKMMEPVLMELTVTAVPALQDTVGARVEQVSIKESLYLM